MSTSSPAAVRQRKDKRSTTPNPPLQADLNAKIANGSAILKEKVEQGKEVAQRDWDYKLALAIITILAFVTRFWGISHPNQVVFDEVHFGKVSHFR
jgi:dolichyl-phosphate-mannose-protein mannosyltransferase